MKFSIITAVYNAEDTINRCVDSVLAQTNCLVEHIIVDGVSTDCTLEYLGQYQDARLKVLSEPDSGIYDAWNKGVDMAQGDWLLFLGADDFLLASDVLQRVIEAARLDPAKRAFLSARLCVGPADGSAVVRESGYGWGKIGNILNSPVLAMPAHGALFHSKGLFAGSRRFDASYEASADKKLFFEEIGRSDIQYIDVQTTFFSMGGVTNRGGNKTRRWLEKRRLRQELGIPFLPRAYLRSLASSVFNDILYFFRKKG